MTTEAWWILPGAALVLGTGVGAWASLRMARVRFKAMLKRTTDELQQRNAATADQLRAAQNRVQAETEQLRGSLKRQIAAAAEEPRAAAARAEERLLAAYAEIDRLQRAVSAPDTGTAELTDGFAATRPMRQGM